MEIQLFMKAKFQAFLLYIYFELPKFDKAFFLLQLALVWNMNCESYIEIKKNEFLDGC